MERLPRLWSSFADGLVSEQNAVEAARLAAELPNRVWAAFDELIGEPAESLTPAKFRLKGRGLRERIHPTSAEARHERAREDRRVWFEPDRDGMGWLGAYLPIDVGHTAMARLDKAAFELAKAPEETRTVAQLRADELGELLIGVGSGIVREVSLALTMPALSAVGHDGGSAVLDGAGPIPMEMAKLLAGEAKSFVRVFTDPITGTVLNMEGRTRRIPKAMKRWLRLRDQVCTFPGCNRRAMHSDLDHTRDVQYGGVTANGNLAHLCRKHHTLKHKTNWRYVQPAATTPDARPTWTSPLGRRTKADPPPF